MSELGKLRWRCRRGMKELDELLLRFLEQRYATLSVQQQQCFAELLELQDPQLIAYLTGRDTPVDPVCGDVIERITAAYR